MRGGASQSMRGEARLRRRGACGNAARGHGADVAKRRVVKQAPARRAAAICADDVVEGEVAHDLRRSRRLPVATTAASTARTARRTRARDLMHGATSGKTGWRVGAPSRWKALPTTRRPRRMTHRPWPLCRQSCRAWRRGPCVGSFKVHAEYGPALSLITCMLASMRVLQAGRRHKMLRQHQVRCQQNAPARTGADAKRGRAVRWSRRARRLRHRRSTGRGPGARARAPCGARGRR